MRGKRFFYYILSGFITGTLLLIYIQYNSARNIHALINGNRQLISEVSKRDNLKDKEREMLVLIDDSGEKALRFSTILIVIVLFTSACLFWYIIRTLRKQSRLISELDASEKKVRETARIKENFLANMSHEIRTPMNAILGFTNLLQKQALEKQSKEYVQTIQRSAENLLTIVNDILDLSKIEAGMMRIEATPFPIRELVHSVETMFRDKAKEKGINLYLRVHEEVPDILEGDATRLTQILVNLIGNALKFTSSGQVSVLVNGKSTIGNTIDTIFTVSDTGIGIEAAKLDSIFNRFEQAEESVTRRYGGTGLGLSIVHELVSLQNGTITAESQPGKGSVFTVTIPYERAENQSATNTNNSLPAVAPPIHLQEARVLVVEDNAINRSLLRHLFSSWQLPFDMTNNGKEAIALIATQAYDLILMDIQMPEMDGYTATRYIREEMGLTVPIIAMTAHALAGEREKCLSAGMNDYLSKPLREEQLQALISRFTAWQCISLQYMKEVSGGDKAYEKEVTAQFLEAIPADLDNLLTAWQQNDSTRLKQLAHNMKTTISVMGLNPLLDPYLNKLEYEEQTAESFNDTFQSLKTICETAMAETRQFYATL